MMLEGYRFSNTHTLFSMILHSLEHPLLEITLRYEIGCDLGINNRGQRNETTKSYYFLIDFL